MGESCQVDFYVLQDPRQSADRLACRLAMMAWEQGYTALVLARDEREAERLDALLWESPPERFLPHGRAGNDGPEPVTVGTGKDLVGTRGEVIINLAPDPVPEPGRFRRLLEVVPADDQERQYSRDKFRSYRALGLQPVSHEMNRG